MTQIFSVVAGIATASALVILNPTNADAQGATHPPARIAVSRAKVLGVGLDQSKRVVRRILGAPARRSVPEFDEAIDDSLQTWTYASGEFVFYGNRLSEIRCQVSACVTPDGVRVGDPQARIEQVYGPSSETTIDGANAIWYIIGDSDCGMTFVIRKGLVAEIRMECDYS